jgi:hypothetical protein
MNDAKVMSGEVTELPDFLNLNLSAYGVRVAPGEAIPTHIEANTAYIDKRLTEAALELGEVMAWTEEQAGEEARRANLNIVKIRLQLIRSQRETARRIGPMLAQVEAWQPPTPEHEGLKTNMKENLLGFSGEMPEEMDYDDPSLPKADYTAESYRQSRIDSLTRTIALSQESRTEAIAGSEKSTAWLQALSASMVDWQPVETPQRQLP